MPDNTGYPITNPTPTGLASLHNPALKAQTSQFIEATGPSGYTSTSATPLDTVEDIES